MHVESRPDFLETDAEAHAVALRIKQVVGITARVVVKPPGGVERSIGKAVRVVDRRPKS